MEEVTHSGVVARFVLPELGAVSVEDRQKLLHHVKTHWPELKEDAELVNALKEVGDSKQEESESGVGRLSGETQGVCFIGCSPCCSFLTPSTLLDPCVMLFPLEHPSRDAVRFGGGGLGALAELGRRGSCRGGGGCQLSAGHEFDCRSEVFVKVPWLAGRLRSCILLRSRSRCLPRDGARRDGNEG